MTTTPFPHAIQHRDTLLALTVMEAALGILLKIAKPGSKLATRCADFTVGRPWGWLERTGWSLGYLLMELAPGCDVAGTAIYMALHGYEWDTAEPQQIKEAACQTLNRAQNVVALHRPSQGQAV